VHAVWDVGSLPAAVAGHAAVAARLLQMRPLPPVVSDDSLIETLDALTHRLLD
jgi:hypothetical protein